MDSPFAFCVKSDSFDPATLGKTARESIEKCMAKHNMHEAKGFNDYRLLHEFRILAKPRNLTLHCVIVNPDQSIHDNGLVNLSDRLNLNIRA